MLILNEAQAPADRRDLKTAICLIGSVCGDPARGSAVPTVYWVDAHGMIVVECIHVAHAVVAVWCLSDWQVADLAHQIRTQLTPAPAGAPAAMLEAA